MIRAHHAKHPGSSPSSRRVAATTAPPTPKTVKALTTARKRLLLAQIVEVNPIDCLDDSGAFDLNRARHVLPACAIQHLVVHETIRPNREGQNTIQRRISIKLVDKIRAIREDDAVLKREKEEHAEAASTSQQKERLAEAEDRARQVIKEQLELERDQEYRPMEELVRSVIAKKARPHGQHQPRSSKAQRSPEVQRVPDIPIPHPPASPATPVATHSAAPPRPPPPPPPPDPIDPMDPRNQGREKIIV